MEHIYIRRQPVTFVWRCPFESEFINVSAKPLINLQTQGITANMNLPQKPSQKNVSLGRSFCTCPGMCGISARQSPYHLPRSRLETGRSEGSATVSHGVDEFARAVLGGWVWFAVEYCRYTLYEYTYV